MTAILSPNVHSGEGPSLVGEWVRQVGDVDIWSDLGLKIAFFSDVAGGDYYILASPPH